MPDLIFAEIPDECRVKTQWRDGKLHITWHKDGEAIAEIAIPEESARLTAAVISVALTGNER